MYIPECNRVEDVAATLAFIQANPFAILISATDSAPFATHLPILAREIDGRMQLQGHMAKANPHWKSVGKDKDHESLIIFHGPHAYIAPGLYEIRESVPTWNYAVVHVYGHVTVFTDEARLRQVLLGMIARFDPSYVEQWSSLAEQYQSRMFEHIVGFEMSTTRVETKFKLSQNRTKAEQESVIRSLASSSDSSVTAVAALMRVRGLGLP